MEHVATSTSGNNVDSGCTRDYTSEFTRTETFNSKEELISWAKKVGKENGITIVVLRSDSGKGKKKPRVTLGCERSGKCDRRNTSPKKSTTVEPKGRRTGTKKCGCPFQLRGEKLAAGNEWELTVVVGNHNHAAGTLKWGHSSEGRLCREEKSVVEDMHKRREEPKEILSALKKRDKHNKSKHRTIYNEIQSLKRRDELDKLEHQSSRLQQLMSKAEEYDFIEKHRTSPMRDNVCDCFFLTQRSSFEFLRAFPTVLIIQSEFEDTMSEWKRVEFSGFTSNQDIFSVASVIFFSKNTDKETNSPLDLKDTSGYEWALNSLRGVMDDKGIVMPDIVILNTRYILSGPKKLIKACNDVFSTAKLLLPDEFFMDACSRWLLWTKGIYSVSCVTLNALKASRTEGVFEQHLMQLRCELSGNPPKAVEYFIDTLLKLKEMFVAAWTNEVMHFGSTNLPYLSRYDPLPYCILEHYLYKCEDPVEEQTLIDRFWKDMHCQIENSCQEIYNDGLYERLEYNDGLLKELGGAISILAVYMISLQIDKIDDGDEIDDEIDDDHNECGCLIKRTHGLPCAHEIANYEREGRPIPLECINPHWRIPSRLNSLRKTGEPNVHETLKRPRLNEEMNTNSPNAGPSIVPLTLEGQPAGDEILGALKKRGPHNNRLCGSIYNELRSLKRRVKRRATVKDELEDQLEDQSFVLRQLMSKVGEYDYIEKHRTTPTIDNVLDFFLTHRTSIELLRAFPTVLKIEFRGKTTMSEYVSASAWDTVEFFGVTSTNMEFCVASAILCPLQDCSFEWALNSLRGVMDDNGGIVMPDIVILETYYVETVDSNHSIKAINNVFSTAKLLFSTDCFDHPEFDWLYESREFRRTWKSLKESATEADFELYLNDLTQQCSEPDQDWYPVKYVIDTLVEPHKEKFIAAWTDKVMHFGNTEREISGHGPRRRYRRRYPTYDILECYLIKHEGPEVVNQTVIDTFLKEMHSDNEKSLIEIDNSFLESLKNKYIHGEDGLKELHGAISIYALNMIREQTKLANEIDDDHSECSCPIKSTHGLPCAHEIAKYKREGRPIPLECINSHWKKLRLKPLRRTGEPNVHETLKRPRLNEEMNTNAHYALCFPASIVEAERNSPNAGPSILPSTPEWQPPGDEVYDIQTPFVDVCPLVLTPYIFRVNKDLPRDGHCGFRAIASFMGYREEVGWVKVREDLTNELMLNSSHYAQLYGSEQRVHELLDALAYSESICLQKKHWMTMPDMGHIIASCYNVVLMHLSSVQCFTFFPLRTAPISISISPPTEIVIGFVKEHFVQVYMKSTGHPMPPPTPVPTRKNPHEATIRERFHKQRSTEWANLYQGRIEDFKSSLRSSHKKNPIVVDIDSLPSVENMYYYFDSLQGD